MKITVNKDNVKIEEFDVVHEGEHRVNKCSFSFSEEYTEELVKKAIFTSQNSSVEVAIINNECNIPTEILKARNIVLLGVYAYKVVDDKLDLRYSPSPDAFKVNSGSYIEGANESEEITPSQFEQYMQAMNDGLNKVEESIKKMDEATSSANDLVDNINQKLENGDFIGPEGPEGPQGVPGTNGKDGVGITTITSGQSTVEEDKTITPITVNKTDGSSQIFKVEAKNGLDGQNGINGQDGKDGKDGVNGQDGLTPTIGDNGNWFIGDTDTGKPSRGEVGPSPDLSDYVKNTDYATTTKAGIIKATNYLNVTSDGVAYASPITQEIYESTNPNVFIAKGTLENIKDYYVESSTPVKNLNTSLIDITPKNNAEGTDNVFDDGIESKLYALGGDGKSEQVVTTGRQLFDYKTITHVPNGENNNGVITATNFNCIIRFTNNPISVESGESLYFSCDIKLNSGSSGVFNQINDNVNANATKLLSPTLTTSYQKYQTKLTYSEKTDINAMLVQILNLSGSAEISNIMISKDSNSEFEPYTNGIPSPSPDYPQEINSIEGSVEFACEGKNLLRIDDLAEKVINGVTISIKNNEIFLNGTVSESGNPYITQVYTKNLKGTYSVKLFEKNPVSSAFRIYLKNQNNEEIISLTNLDGKYTKYINSNMTSLLMYFNKGTVFSNYKLSIMLVEGDNIPTEYEPCIEPNEVTFDLGQEKLRSVGDVKDELVVDLDTGDYYKVENVGEVVLDGSEDWLGGKLGTNSPDYIYFYSNKSYPDIKPDEYRGYCNIFKNLGNSMTIDTSVNTDTISIGNTPYNGIRIMILSSRLTSQSISAFKDYLTTNNAIIHCILITPTTKKLGTLSTEDLAKLKTFKGYNNVTINTNLGLMNIRFTYGLDIKKYIDNKLAEISSAMIEEG